MKQTITFYQLSFVAIWSAIGMGFYQAFKTVPDWQTFANVCYGMACLIISAKTILLA